LEFVSWNLELCSNIGVGVQGGVFVGVFALLCPDCVSEFCGVGVAVAEFTTTIFVVGVGDGVCFSVGEGVNVGVSVGEKVLTTESYVNLSGE
jgi:hypothetical protein